MSRGSTRTLRRIVSRGVQCSPKSFRRAATQRLKAAKFLLKHSTYRLDTVHLAGYAAECSLKALILERAPESKWAAVCEEVGSGAKAHNFDFLKGILVRRQCSISAEVAEGLDVVKNEWTTGLRYEGAQVPFREAEDLIRQVESICRWAERSS